MYFIILFCSDTKYVLGFLNLLWKIYCILRLKMGGAWRKYKNSARIDWADNKLTLCLSPASCKALWSLIKSRHIWRHWHTSSVHMLVIHVDWFGKLDKGNVILILWMDVLWMYNQVLDNSIVLTPLINIETVFTHSHSDILCAAKSV